MTTFESKIVAIKRTDEDIYKVLSSFQNFSPFIPADKIEDWEATEDSCSFTIKGIGKTGLKMVEREPFKTIKVGGADGAPLDFNLWIQLKQVTPYDTRMKITVKAELNMMMKMLLKDKLQKGIDAMADQIAMAFNR